MERHLLNNIEGNETTETKETFHIPSIIKEEIDIHTEIYEKSNEILCSNDNSIPFCNILLSQFLDLTPENDLTPIKNELDTRTAAEKCEINFAAESSDTEPKEKKKNYLNNANKQTNILDNHKKRQKIQENYLQDANEEVDIEVEINKRKRKTERQKRYRKRKKLENNELDLTNKRKNMAEASKRYRERQKVKKSNLQDANEIEAEINKRKKNAEKYKRYRQRQKMRRNNLQDANDIEVEINERKKHAERQKRYTERKKLENDELYWANKRKRMAEAMKRYRLKKKKINELQDADEQVEIEIAAVNKNKKTCKKS